MSDDRVVVITGITRGIGKAIATACAKKGFRVVGISRSEKEGAAILHSLYGESQSEWLSIGADVSSPEEVEAGMNQAVSRFGKIDVLVNNAGTGTFQSIAESCVSDWDRIIDVNLKGTYLCMRAVLPQMIRNQSGVIINVASVCGLRGYPNHGIYCASKFGIVGLTESAAKEVAPHHIKVYALCPHGVNTGFANNRNSDLTKPQHLLTSEEVSDVVLDFILNKRKPQICEMGIHPMTLFLDAWGIPLRKIFTRKVRCLL